MALGPRPRAQAALQGRPRRGLARPRPLLPEEVAEARAALAPLLTGKPTTDLRVTAIGHGHLDLAWLWPLRETHRKARRTFTHQLTNLDADPDYVYGSSQPQQWAWLESEHPDLFARVLDAAASGRLEPQGGLWVEPDMNLPSGESIVRQALHGQRYFEKHLGRLMQTCWLPDVFGYNANLPQLLAKAGMAYFLTIKLSWNEHNDFPHRSFVWEGIDGSQVLVHMPPEGTYNSSATPLSLVDLTAKYPERDAAPEALLVFGTGDGGGGPGRTHLELVKRLGSLEGFPAVEYGTSAAFFDRLATHRDKLPVWRGELYLEKHQGTFTTQAATKRWNRRVEERLHDLEHLAALAWAAGGDYPREALDEAWRDLLLFQFHDILPGSSITRVYDEAEPRYAEIHAALTTLIDEHLTGSAETPTVTNTLATPRAGHIRTEDRWWAYAVEPFATASCTPWRGESARITDHTLSNEHVHAHWVPDGELTSLVDLATGVEHAGEGLNRLVVHRDPWSYFDAWDINSDYLDKPTDTLRPTRVETFLDGPRAVRRSHYRHGRTIITQDAVLTPGQRFLSFETTVDWHERHRMLRAEFRPARWSDEVACEIQYGHYRRSTRNDTSIERAQYEVCAHRWVDVSDETGGLSLLNDAKYGHRAKEGVLSLNLLRAPIYPDPKADRGRNVFTYALFPHAGPVEDADTLAQAAHLNQPVLVGRAALHDPVFTVDAPGVQLAAVKVAEDGDALILRLYEARGRATSGRLATNLPVVRVDEADLLERVTGPADLVDLRFGPFELKTLRVEVRRPAG